VFPQVHDLGLRRLREHLLLEPVEYPTTRKTSATARERAADIHAAFADSEIKAIMAVRLSPAAEMTDENPSWEDPAALEVELPTRPGPGWTWAGDQRAVTGPTWGGCLEILDFQLRAGRYLLAPEAYDGCVLLLETSEEMPDAEYVYRVLMGMGERGMLQHFAAVVVASPKAWDREVGQSVVQRTQFAADQRESILRALDEYNPRVPTVFGLDFGHTDPQIVIPHGGPMTVDGINRTVTVTY
jgi:muramoyltetrapeptide carboxypeptidase LdcA involved in peptidoglycan recycling